VESGSGRQRIVELKPGIYQIRADRPSSHVYLIKGSKKNVLIDTGTAAHFSILEGALASVGLTPGDIHLIILTHEHFDHIGSTPFFCKTAIIAAHKLAANKIELEDEFVILNKYYDIPMNSFGADIWLDGEILFDLGDYRLAMIYTPGHCSGCICLYEPLHKILFTGDTVLAGGVLSGILGSGNISDYINSLGRLRALQVNELYPGHGGISKNPQEDINKAYENARALMAESKILFELVDTKKAEECYFMDLRKFPLPDTASNAKKAKRSQRKGLGK
jgi:glyoxylase-like metal-dependent hydrolase (beta-lactamase superfamily II)